MDRESSQTPSGSSQPSPGNTPQTTTSASQSVYSQPAASAAASAPTPASVPATAPAPATSGSTSNPTNSKRRRGLGVVTPNACTECRKKRAKCDGKKPCGRCRSQKDVECMYEIPVRQSKENLRNEIESLRLFVRSQDAVLATHSRPELWDEVRRRLNAGGDVRNISEWLGSQPGCHPPASDAALLQPGDHDVGGAAPLRAIASSVAPSTTTATTTTSSSSLIGAGPGPALAPRNPDGDELASLHARQPSAPSDQWQGNPRRVASHSQAGPTRSSSHAESLSWSRDARGPAHSRVGSWAESMRPEQMTDRLSKYRGLEQVLSPLGDTGLKPPAVAWTNITGDVNLMQHLLALYFCWEYPTFASLSKEHFLLDFQEGRPRYCSPILVNALLALGCRFSTHPMTLADPDNPYTSGDHFFKETQRLLNRETEHHSLTTIQALGIMSIREASYGRDSESWYFAGQSIRLAIEMGLHRVQDGGDEDELAVQSATFWGAFALDHAWSLATGTLPQCSSFPHLPPRPAIIGDIEASLWVPYTDDGAPLQRSCEQPSNVRSVYKCFCELSELVHQSLYVLHSPGKPLTARDLLGIYTQYLNWYDQIPEVLRLGHNFTPAVLFAHMYYHFAIMLLFRPLIKLRMIGSKVLPRDVCSQAADAIQGLLTSYSQLYTLQRTPSFVPYFVLTSSIMHLAIGASSMQSTGSEDEPDKAKSAATWGPRVSKALKRGVADLTEMAPCHHFAEQALNILRYLARKWSVDVDVGDQGRLTAEEYDRLARPYTSSLNFFSPNFRTGDLVCRWGTGTEARESPTLATKTAADSMKNPLFWPFPMQGRPILPEGKELEQAGFILL
ncbi:hypothetical protein CDD83_9208 [Cordyceps sp. RAO-2017]|nr:hypothetical protein CDD83_9208 [Cordyceps sp. RAO-2017]